MPHEDTAPAFRVNRFWLAVTLVLGFALGIVAEHWRWAGVQARAWQKQGADIEQPDVFSGERPRPPLRPTDDERRDSRPAGMGGPDWPKDPRVPKVP